MLIVSPRPFALVPFCLAGMCLAGASLADQVELARCNQLAADGVYRPVLVVTTPQGATVYQPESHGLTRAIVFSETRAQAWALAHLGLNPDDTQFTYYPSCGPDGGSDGAVTVVAVAGPTEPDDDDGDATGDGIIAGEAGDDDVADPDLINGGGPVQFP